MEASGIGVEIGGTTLLDDVSLTLLPGTITCLLGPNGAGKSTLLRVLSGTLTPSRGEVQFGDRPLGRWSADDLARHRAVLSQSTSLGFAFNVIEVIALGRSPHVRQSSAPLDRKVIGAAMAATDVGHLAARHYPTLSGGEQQRVQLARVLAHQQQVLNIARDFSRAGGTVIAVLHDLNLAASVADTVCFLKHGRIIASGRPETVLTGDTIAEVFDIRVKILEHPVESIPLVFPLPPLKEANAQPKVAFELV